ncbi:MAG: YggS family pyridoxal phosphate-dependent enzyme [Sphingorhabdus sp.]
MQEATIDSPAARLDRVEAEIATAAKLARRSADEVTLIAVSKTRTADEIKPLIDVGHRVFGENRVQEAGEKWPTLKTAHPDIQLHLIGQLQSNKAGEAVALFDAIHTVDRLSLVSALGKAMREQEKKVPCFIQVNIGAEEQKGGCAIGALPELINGAMEAGIPVSGLMCLPPADIEPAPFFALLAELAARHELPALSMGMSNDFPVAVMLGATHVRVGTALFGARKQ